MSKTTKQTMPPRRRRTAKQFAPATGWAALEEYIADKLREARRCKRIAEKACAQSPVDYWTGISVALVKLRRNVTRWKKAPPNVKDQATDGAREENQPKKSE